MPIEAAMLMSYSRLAAFTLAGGGVKTHAPDNDKRRIGDSVPFFLTSPLASGSTIVVTLHNALMAFHVADTPF